MKKFYYECDYGCTIIEAKDIIDARMKAKREVGTVVTITVCREATEKDLAWVRSMGGRT